MLKQFLSMPMLAMAMASPPQIANLHWQDASKMTHTATEWKSYRAILLFFVATDCPVSNRYVPEMNRIAKAYATRCVLTLAVLADWQTSPVSAAAYAREFQFAFPVLRDPNQDLVHLAGATVTPQAAVLSTDGDLLYGGRIDNRVEDFGSERQSATVHDVRDALDAAIEGRAPRASFTRSVGCAIPIRKENANR